MTRRFVGQATPRLEGPDKVTGKSRYSADVKLPGMLRGKILRSPYPESSPCSPVLTFNLVIDCLSFKCVTLNQNPVGYGRF